MLEGATEYWDTEGIWLTPAGSPARMAYRVMSRQGDPLEPTSDWNTITSPMGANDEYHLPKGLTGWAMDLGAHIGSVTVSLALDNPGLRIIAVEPVPDNVRLLRRNVEMNGLSDQVTVIDGAIGGPADKSVTVWYGYRGSLTAEHHAFIGNSSLAYDHGGVNEHAEAIVEGWSLSRLLTLTDGTCAWLKVDTEGGEWAFLTDPAVAQVELITGEWHNVRGHVQADIVDLLGPTHDVTFSGPEGGPGGFVAVRR